MMRNLFERMTWRVDTKIAASEQDFRPTALCFFRLNLLGSS
jgi:hypothetical protein